MGSQKVIFTIPKFDYNYQKAFLFAFLLKLSIRLRFKKKTAIALLVEENNKLKDFGNWGKMASSCNCPIII